MGAGKLTATLALGGSILALGFWYYGAIDALSDSQGAAQVQPAPIPDTVIPEALTDQIAPITQGYQDHYFGPIDDLGAQVSDPSVPDPVATPIPQLPAPQPHGEPGPS